MQTMNPLKVSIVSIMAFPLVLAVSAQRAQAFNGLLYFDSPTVSEIPTDGSSIEMRFLIGEMSDGVTYLYWECCPSGEFGQLEPVK